MQTATSTVEGFLEAAASLTLTGPGINGYHSLSEFILKNGRRWAPQALPREFRRGAPRQCFMNAAKLALIHDGLIYCEGCASAFFPVEHAWCVDAEGKVIDTTWREDLAKCQYFGIAFKREFLRQELLTNGVYGLIDRMETGFRLLKTSPRKWRHKINDSVKDI